MRQSTAQYLLRFDDLCPTVSRAGWQRFLPLLTEYNIKPILAIVPDNQDAELAVSPTDPVFWDEMRAQEAAGAAIALHGYRHLCESRGQSLVPLAGSSEFAGVEEATQRQWIHAGIEILRSHGLTPKVWVAPRHGFDRATLHALQAEEIGVVSDGLALGPFLRHGLLWIPQQLWEPVEKRSGLWTICLHPNTTSNDLIYNLEAFLEQHAAEFTSVDRVLAEYRPATRGFSDLVFSASALARIRAARLKKKWLGAV
jgi:predicted deacetylase